MEHQKLYCIISYCLGDLHYRILQDVVNVQFQNGGTRKKVGLFWTNIKQLLDEIFVISGITKVEVSFISRAEGRG